MIEFWSKYLVSNCLLWMERSSSLFMRTKLMNVGRDGLQTLTKNVSLFWCHLDLETFWDSSTFSLKIFLILRHQGNFYRRKLKITILLETSIFNFRINLSPRNLIHSTLTSQNHPNNTSDTIPRIIRKFSLFASSNTNSLLFMQSILNDIWLLRKHTVKAMTFSIFINFSYCQILLCNIFLEFLSNLLSNTFSMSKNLWVTLHMILYLYADSPSFYTNNIYFSLIFNSNRFLLECTLWDSQSISLVLLLVPFNNKKLKLVQWL